MVLTAWLLLPIVGTPLLAHFAARAGVEIAELDIGVLGWRQTTVPRAVFTLRSRHGPIVVALHGVRLAYSLAGPTWDALAIDKASVSVDYQPSQAGRGEGGMPVEMPLERLAIQQLELMVQGPWGRSELKGRMELHREETGLYTMRVHQDGLSLHAIVSVPAATLKAWLAAPAHPSLAELKLDFPNDGMTRASVHADDAAQLLQTLAAGTLLPEGLRERVAPSVAVDTMPKVVLDGQVETNAADADTRVELRLSQDRKVLATSRLALSRGEPARVEGDVDMPLITLFDLATPWLPADIGRPGAGQAKGRFELSAASVASWSAVGRLRIDGLAWSTTFANVTDAELLVRTSEMNEKRIAVSVLLTQAGASLAWADLRLPRAGSWVVDARAALPAATLFDLAAPSLPAALRKARFESGRIRAWALFERQTGEWKGGARIALEDLTMKLGNARLEDASAEVSFTDPTAPQGEVHAEAPVLSLSSAVAGRRLQANARFHPDAWEIDTLRLGLFGGEVALVPTTIPRDGGAVSSALRLSGIDLAQLLRSVNRKELAGSGKLEGALPIVFTFRPPSVEMRDGRIRGVDGGRLEFREPRLKGKNLALKALEDFRYHTLTAGVNYLPSGDYRLGLRLEGHNPALLNAHPLALNLNVKGRLPALLREGILTGDFDRPVLEWVQANGINHAGEPDSRDEHPNGTPELQPPAAVRKNR
jgi:hypothetical protein